MGRGRNGPARSLVSGTYSSPPGWGGAGYGACWPGTAGRGCRRGLASIGTSIGLGIAPSSPNRIGGTGMASVRRAIHEVEGDLKDGRSVAGHGPTAHPATVLVVVNSDHLVEVFVTGEVNTVTLMEGHRFGE